MKYVYRAFSVSHSRLRLYHIGDFDKKEDAEEAIYIDEMDEPSPDKSEFHSWHVVTIHPSIRKVTE